MRRRRTLPPIPAQIPSLKGPVPVTLHLDPRGSRNEPCGGSYDLLTRAIEVHSALTPADRWWTLFHEATHMVIADAEITMRAKLEEAVCSAVATWLTNQMRGPDPLLVPARGHSPASEPPTPTPAAT